MCIYSFSYDEKKNHVFFLQNKQLELENRRRKKKQEKEGNDTRSSTTTYPGT
jgi:hypothetical protein